MRSLERLGVSAVIIEDKEGLKRNSLFGTEVAQEQSQIDDFCFRLSTGKKAQITDDFMVIARIESLILGKGMDDALRRATAYAESGADAVMIHSRAKEPDEIFEFIDAFRRDPPNHVPIVVVPTSYDQVYESELIDHGVSVVIYANHLMRAAYPPDVESRAFDTGAWARTRSRHDVDFSLRRIGDHPPRESRMISPPETFCGELLRGGVSYFVGVPDSLLKNLGSHFASSLTPDEHTIAANEGTAVAMAIGHHLRTGELAAVYLQNSGIGNAVNPLLSLADPEVYGIPMLLIVGWRGEPGGVKDEPQHVKQGGE